MKDLFDQKKSLKILHDKLCRIFFSRRFRKDLSLKRKTIGTDQGCCAFHLESIKNKIIKKIYTKPT